MRIRNAFSTGWRQAISNCHCKNVATLQLCGSHYGALTVPKAAVKITYSTEVVVAAITNHIAMERHDIWSLCRKYVVNTKKI